MGSAVLPPARVVQLQLDGPRLRRRRRTGDEAPSASSVPKAPPPPLAGCGPRMHAPEGVMGPRLVGLDASRGPAAGGGAQAEPGIPYATMIDTSAAAQVRARVRSCQRHGAASVERVRPCPPPRAPHARGNPRTCTPQSSAVPSRPAARGNARGSLVRPHLLSQLATATDAFTSGPAHNEQSCRTSPSPIKICQARRARPRAFNSRRAAAARRPAVRGSAVGWPPAPSSSR